MSRKPSPKRRLVGPFRVLGEMAGTPIDRAKKRDKSPREEKLVSRIGDKLAPALERAFQESGLDSDNKAHQFILLAWLAWAVYGGKRPGAPKKWTKKKNRTLLNTVQKMRADPHLTDSDCCDLLSLGKGGSDQYRGLKSRTLRRTLQRAKALERAAKLLVVRSST